MDGRQASWLQVLHTPHTDTLYWSAVELGTVDNFYIREHTKITKQATSVPDISIEVLCALNYTQEPEQMPSATCKPLDMTDLNGFQNPNAISSSLG